MITVFYDEKCDLCRREIEHYKHIAPAYVVASTFSHKPYIFNLENVDKYFSKLVDTSPLTNQPLHASYETLQERLFPNIGRSS